MKAKTKTLSLFELMEIYPTEETAIRYFERVRWGDNPYCVRCNGTNKITPQKKHVGRYWCGSCRKYFTARTGTPMEYGKVDLRKWLHVAYLLLTARKGVSSVQLSKEMGVTQNTAWYMLHRLRIGASKSREFLSGAVEVDETYIGGLEKNKHVSKKLNAGRGTVGKQAVVGMRERGGKVRAQSIDRTDKATLHAMVEQNVVPGSILYTDENKAYIGLGSKGYGHETVRHSAGQYVNGMAHTNGLESVWAVIKRGFHGVYHHWSMKHMQAYVDEYTFRLNEGNVRVDTQDRLDALFASMPDKTITYAQLTAN